MRVQVFSATTGDLLWECVSGSFWHVRGWEFRGWICEAIDCRQYFSVILLVRQLLLCDVAFISEHAEGNNLQIQLVRRQLVDPSGPDLRLAADAIRSSNRLHLWAVLSRGVHMRIILPSGTSRASTVVGLL